MFAYKTFEAAAAAALKLAAQRSESSGRCVLLVPSFERASRVKRLLAEAGLGFGVAVETPSSWVRDLWECYGSGQELVSPVDRVLVMRRAFQQLMDEAPETALPPTRGMVRLACDVAKLAAPFLAVPPGMVEGAWAQVLNTVRCYLDLLEGMGLTEESLACAHLARRRAAHAPVVVLDCDTTAAQDLVLACANAVRVEVDAEGRQGDGGFVSLTQFNETNPPSPCLPELEAARAPELRELSRALYRPDAANPVQASGCVCFAFAAGPTAQWRLLAQELRDSLCGCADAAATAAVASRDPLAVFGRVAPALAASGIGCNVAQTVPFGETAFGKMWLGLLELLLAEGGPGSFDPRLPGDVSLSPFSHMSMASAHKEDERVRRWRGQTVDEALTDMTAFAYFEHQDFMSAVAEGDLVQALELQVSWIAGQRGWPEGYRALQLEAARAALAVHSRAGQIGLSEQQVHAALAEVGVSYRATLQPREGGTPADAAQPAGAPQPAPQVHFMKLSQVGAQGTAFDVVLLADQTADAYPLKDEAAAVDDLLKALGAYKPRNRVAKLRRQFADALRSATHSVTILRCLHDSAAKELRPSALVEELVDCYRSNPTDPAEVSKVTGLPPQLAAFSRQLGEEDIDGNLRFFAPQGPEESALFPGARVEAPVAGQLPAHDAAKLLVPHLMGDGRRAPMVSPSAIERYLACPYSWFAANRLKAGQGVDADFGNLAFGTFSHAVLEATHNLLRQQGQPRVTWENLAQAQELLQEAAARQIALDALDSSRSDAIIPWGPSDELRIQEAVKNLKGYLEWEAGLLPDFHPLGSEVQFGLDEPLEYAGMLLSGSIDRVDVDAFGRAVVLDYKGSVGAAYRLRQKDDEAAQFTIPRKVQALVYAQAVRRKLGVRPVGALYVSYGKNHGIAGAYDSTVLGPLDLPDIDAESCAEGNFLELLDNVEEAIAQRLRSLQEGAIAPDPASSDACTYCPVSYCAVRDALQAASAGTGGE